MSDITDWLENNRRELRAQTKTRSAVITRHYRYSLSQLWSACTERERLARWFAHVEGSLVVGADLRIDAGLPHSITSKLLACEPEQRLLLTWSYDGDPLDPPDEVEVRFAKEGNGSRLTIEHRSGVLYPWAMGVGSGWESWIWGLDATLAGNLEQLRGAPDDVTARIDARWRALPEPAAELIAQGTRRTLRMQRKFPQPPDEVWAVLLSSLSRWYPGRIEGELVAGAKLRFSYEDGTSLQGEVVALRAPHLLMLREANDELSVELAHSHSGTLLTFKHSFDAPGAPASFATGWDGCLNELWLALTNAPPAERSEAQRMALSAAYARYFGAEP
jgi:uncharacterized protein YndB with AHSA1/START domain